MAKEVFMPALGMAQETGLLLEWLKLEGQSVSKGEPIMVVETDKTTVEIESPASGTLVNVSAKAGETIPVGQVIALILGEGEMIPPPVSWPSRTESMLSSTPASPPRSARPVSPVAARIADEHGVDLNQVVASGSWIQKEDVLAYLAAKKGSASPRGAARILASPKARRLAREQDLDLSKLRGSGPDGAVLAADVLNGMISAQASSHVPTPTLASSSPEVEDIPMSRKWGIMAQRLTESWQTIPHFYLEAEANASQLTTWLGKVSRRTIEKVTYTDLIVKLAAIALRQHPRVNASWVDGTIRANPDVNIGLAVAVEEGLLVPVIHHADRLGLSELAARRRELVAGAQVNKLALADINHGTFTISNLGMFGVDAFSAIVNPPQAAILALGKISDKVVPLNGEILVQPIMRMTLSCDHRLVDGARGAKFLQTLVALIQDPLIVLD